MMYSDDKLVELIKTGDSKAFEQLFNKYWEPLFATAMCRFQSEELSKDILQELFVDLWKRRNDLHIQSNVKGYLFTALKHRIINKMKSEAVRKKYEKMTIRFYETNNLSTEHQFSKNYLEEEMEKQLEKLPVRCREVFKLSRIEHMSYKEIGKNLNISPKTVGNHIRRALKELRPYLKQVVCL